MKLIYEDNRIEECKKTNCNYKICPFENYIQDRNPKKVSICKEGKLEHINVNDLETIDISNLISNNFKINSQPNLIRRYFSGVLYF